MSTSHRPYRVACLVLDNPPPGSPEDKKYGPFHFGFEFKRWLSRCPHVQLEFTNYDTLQGKFPKLPNDLSGVSASNESEAYDLYILTGSHNGAYEEVQWIRDLEAWIRKADEAKAKVLGICFGHQVVATAFGGTVTLNPKGWEIGAHEFDLNSAGQGIFKGRKSIKLQYTHQDAVMQIPDSCINLGGNPNTQCQAMVKGHHIITIQGHPEFSQVTMEGLLRRKLDAGIIDEPSYQIYRRSLEEYVDNDFVACSCLEYLNLHPSIEQTNSQI